MQDCVTDWQSPVIPPTIRRPWRVFEEDLEEKVTSNASQVGQVDAKVREQIAAVQAKGARVAFLSLSETERQTYYQVALHELSAFVFWRRSQLARQKSGEILPTDMEAGWDLLDMNDKGEWLPQDPIAFLRADAQWATLLADVHGGDEQMVGTEDLQAVPTPMKSEILATTKAPVKKEPSAPAAAAPAPQPPVKKEPSAPASKPAGAPDAGVTKPPAATAQQEASAAAPTAAKASAKALKQEPAPPAKAEFPKKAAVEKETEQTVTGSKQPSSAVVPAPAAHEKKRKEAKPAPEATRRSRRVNPDAETNGAAEKKAAAVEASRTGRATARKRAHEPHERAEATAKQQGARRFRGAEDAGPANLFPEALEAKCCVCNGSDASMDNDLAMCDRCDKAFHAKCHDPPVAYFGRPDDQWFCATCTRELAEMRELSLKVDDFCWVQCTGEAHPWPAQVVRIDFCSLADPRPYWVQYFDAGPPEGQWVGEVNVKAWTAGPRWGSIHQARRRNAVRLAEAAGAPALSTVMPAPSTPKRKPPAPLKEGDSPQSPERKRKRPAKEGTSGAPAARRSSRVQAMLDRKAPQGGQKVPTSRKAPRLRREPEKNDTEDDEFMQQATEMRSLIAAAKERQRKLEEELAQVANGKQMVATEAS